MNIESLKAEFDEGVGWRARIGLVVLASDHTLEHEFKLLVDEPGVGVFHSRIEMSTAVTPETLSAMRGRIASTSKLILPGMPLSVIAYGCTSASMVIGEHEVGQLLSQNHPGAASTTPITAAREALRALGAKRIGIVTPYRDDINQGLREWFSNSGFEVSAFASFEEEDDNKVARITQDCIDKAVLKLGQREDVDTVFASCTNIRLASRVAHLESMLGKPVTSSNHALAWHCRRLAGVDNLRPEFGRLFEISKENQKL